MGHEAAQQAKTRTAAPVASQCRQPRLEPVTAGRRGPARSTSCVMLIALARYRRAGMLGRKKYSPPASLNEGLDIDDAAQRLLADGDAAFRSDQRIGLVEQRREIAGSAARSAARTRTGGRCRC